jgi:hypothetical protein
MRQLFCLAVVYFSGNTWQWRGMALKPTNHDLSYGTREKEGGSGKRFPEMVRRVITSVAISGAMLAAVGCSFASMADPGVAAERSGEAGTAKPSGLKADAATGTRAPGDPEHELYMQYGNDVDGLMRWFAQEGLPDEMKRQALALILNRPLAEPQLAWLRDMAQHTDDTAMEQMIDMVLLRNYGDSQAAARLIDSGEREGFRVPLDYEAEKELARRYPDSRLAAGIASYEHIRGAAYFFADNLNDGYLYQNEGDDFADPEKAIPQWLAFLRDFPLHPSADDAAYRLARCYQKLGLYREALHGFDQAMRTGDGDMTYEAKGLFLYVLDVDMTGEDLQKLDAAALPAWSGPWVAYTRAVNVLRDGDFADAAKQLSDFIAAYDGADLFAPLPRDMKQKDGYAPGGEYQFWDKVKEQQRLAETLAALQRDIDGSDGKEKTAKQYALGAAVYRQPLLFYNHLWRGTRQNFFWIGQVGSMQDDASLKRFILRFNHLVRAGEIFSSIDLNEADPDLAAKTLFSLALCKSKLIDYGQEIAYMASDQQLEQEMIQTLQELLRRFPDSELADDALMLMYVYNGDIRQLHELLERYPNGDQAEKAKLLLTGA